jgi:hypothetical protein
MGKKLRSNLYLSGRFGNQIFQVCLALYQTKVSNAPFSINGKVTRPRNLYLLIKSKIISVDEIELNYFQKLYLNDKYFGILYDRIIGLREYLLYKIEKKQHFRRLASFFRPNLEYVEDEKWKSLVRPQRKVYGFFQDKKLVENTWLELKQRFMVSELCLDFPGDPKTVVVHVRLTDFIQHPEIGVLPENYYLESLKNFQNFKVLVITDDEVMLKLRYPNLHSMSEIFSQTQDEFKSLQLISNAKNVIMANSTFSYWGGVFALMKDSSCNVYAPRPWRADGQKEAILLTEFKYTNVFF